VDVSQVHHNDPYLNISTAFRIHFLELFIIFILKAISIIIFGIEEALVLTSEAVMTFLSCFITPIFPSWVKNYWDMSLSFPLCTVLIIQRNGTSMTVIMALFYLSGIDFLARYQN